MKNSMVLMGVVASAAMLTDSAIASTAVAARAPSDATAQVLSSFVDRYAARAAARGLRNTPTEAASTGATDITLYPTADRHVAFVSFRMLGSDRIALVETHGGRVTRFNDFASVRSQDGLAVTAQVGDAQAQARSIISPTSTGASATSTHAPQVKGQPSAQEQAAELLRFASVKSESVRPSQVATRNVPRSIGDSSQMARAFMVPSSGE